MLAIMGAFGQEIIDLRRQMVIEEVVARRDCRLYRGKFKNRDILLVQTGMGKERAENATQFVLDRYPVTALISLGFAGALTPDLTIGDVVVCSTMHCASGFEKEDGRLEAYAADANLLALASSGPRDASTSFLLGTGVTVPRLVSSPQRKQELGHEFRAQIVDMESYWIARMASARLVPLITIRSISDTLQHGLQPLDHILAPDGRLLWKRVAPYFLLHPQYLASVFTPFSNMQRAKGNLTAFVSHLVARI
jgi:adenosylhomocysteine nucleosidase